MKLLVCGGREYSDQQMVADVLRDYKENLDEIAHGGARGADALAGAWAINNGIPCRVYPANWQKHGRAAGPIRNAQMLELFKPDRVAAFTGGTGTANMISIAEKAGVPVDRYGVYVFVFGSNLAGRHGKGAALEAKNRWGAVYGQGEGRQGASYGIPTKDANIRTRPLKEIQNSVSRFLEHAESNPYDIFKVTRVGCGLAGYTDKEIAPMFAGYSSNVVLPINWQAYV